MPHTACKEADPAVCHAPRVECCLKHDIPYARKCKSLQYVCARCTYCVHTPQPYGLAQDFETQLRLPQSSPAMHVQLRWSAWLHIRQLSGLRMLGCKHTATANQVVAVHTTAAAPLVTLLPTLVTPQHECGRACRVGQRTADAGCSLFARCCR